MNGPIRNGSGAITGTRRDVRIVTGPCHSRELKPGSCIPDYDLWGDVDRKWTLPPYNYPVLPSRQQAYMDAMQRNLQFMQQHAADIEIISSPDTIAAGQQLTVNVKVTNKTGHKLPTGFAEGRQMWIHLT